MAAIDLMAPTFLAFGDVEEALRKWKPVFAGLLARGVGPGHEDSHAAAYLRAGYGDAGAEIASRMAAGDAAGAAASVAHGFVLQTRLAGDDDMVRPRPPGCRRHNTPGLCVETAAHAQAHGPRAASADRGGSGRRSRDPSRRQLTPSPPEHLAHRLRHGDGNGNAIVV